MSHPAILPRKLLQLAFAMGALTLPLLAQPTGNPRSAKPHIKAQQLVEMVLASHPELAGVELASVSPGTAACQTVASTDPHDIGEKCDTDELTAIKTNQPFAEDEVENGQHVWDITSPLHDAGGKLVGTLGMDVKPQPGQTRQSVLKLASEVVHNLEVQIPSKDALFKPTS